jgi:hypothetical protein
MNTPLFHAIMFFVMLVVGISLLSMFVRMRRASAVDPGNPKTAKMMKLKWLFIAGIACCFLSASMSLASWMMSFR